MPTLQGIDGRTLVADLSPGLNVLSGAFGTPQSRATRDRNQQLEELRQKAILGTLGGIGQPTRPQGAISEGGAVPGVSGPAPSPGGTFSVSPDEQNRRIQRLSVLAPKLAASLQTTINNQDAREAAAVKASAVEGARNAALIQRAGRNAPAGQKLQAQRAAIQRIATAKQRAGQLIDREIELMNMPGEQLDLETDRIQLAATEVKNLFPERFEDVTDAQGRTVAQRNVASRRLEDVPDEVSGGGSGGLFSAKTEILEDGTTIQAGPSGRVVVRNPAGQEVEGEERLAVLRKAQQAALDQARAKAGSKAAGTQAIKMSGDMLERLGSVRNSITNIRSAEEALRDGAETGAIASRLPSIRSASVRLDNIQKRMGLDIIQNTTFGALSEGELALALSTALPTQLEGPELLKWLGEKRVAQEKLADYLEDAAVFLGDPGTTAADWTRIQRDFRREVQASEGQGGNDVEITGGAGTEGAPRRLRFDAQGNVIQ